MELDEGADTSFDEVAFTSSVVGAGVRISSGFITATDPTGIVTYYGDARFLSGMPTSQWLDKDVGLGFTSIYNRGYVGVATDDPRHTLQIGGTTDPLNFGHGVGITSEGNIYATGIVTAHSYVGMGSELTLLDGANIGLGTISNDRLPVLLNSKLPADVSISGIVTATGGFSGNITGNVTGNLDGTAELANTAVKLQTSRTISITGDMSYTSSSFNGTGNVTGTAATFTGTVDVGGLDGVIYSGVSTTATSKTVVNREFCEVTAAAQTITLPASPTAGHEVYVAIGNFTDTVVARNGSNIMSLAEDMTLDVAYKNVRFVYVNSTIGWRIN